MTIRFAMLSICVVAAFARGAPLEMPGDPPAGGVPSDAELERIQRAAVVAEIANVNGLEWEPYYLAFMKLERRKDWTDAQVKYIGTYFGFVQGAVHDAVARRTPTEAQKADIKKHLAAEIERCEREATTRPAKKRSE